MTRSYNSRKGKYKRHIRCGCWKCRSNRQKARYRRTYRANVLKFYGTLYKYKQKKRTIHTNAYNRPIYNDKYKIISYEWIRKPIIKSKCTYYYDKYVVPAKESYLTWSWLRGKPNKKGQRAPTGHW